MHLSYSLLWIAALFVTERVPTADSFKCVAQICTTTRRLPVESNTALYMSVPNGLDTLASGLASIARLPYGVTVSETAKPIDDDSLRLFQLFDVENNRDCRVVRERITELDLVVETVIPAASNSRVFVDSNYEYSLAQDATIPRLVVMEGAKEKVLIGSNDITSYLNENFSDNSSSTGETVTADGDFDKEKVVAALAEIGSYVSVLLRLGRGQMVATAASATSPIPVPRPSKPLILYSYEGNQFCRLVREVLTELDLPYELRSAGKESPRRQELAEITGGSSQCPYLIDPNTDTSMPESADIVKYLYKTYALWTPPSEILEAASSVVTPVLKPVYKMIAPMQVSSYNEDKLLYKDDMANTKVEIETEVSSAPVVVYTYSLSPFCSQATELLDNLGVEYKEISLGSEWIPGLISEPAKRAALGEMTGQTSLPHVFVGGKSIGGLFSGNPGLVPSLEEGTFLKQVEGAKMSSSVIDTAAS